MTTTHNPDRFHDIADVITTSEAYRDFEGFADAPEIAEITVRVRDAVALFPDTDPNVLGDIVANLVLEDTEETGDIADADDIAQLAYVVNEMLSTRRWMRTGIDWATV